MRARDRVAAPAAVEPAKAGFFESLPQVPEQFGRMMLGNIPRDVREIAQAIGNLGSGQKFEGLQSAHESDVEMAKQGDEEAAKRVRAYQTSLSTTVGAMVPGGPAVTFGKGALPLIGSLATRAGLGAAGGGVTMGIDAAAGGEPVAPAAVSGAIAGGVGGAAFGALGGSLKWRAAQRLLKRGKPVPSQLAEAISDEVAGAAAGKTPLERVMTAVRAAPRIRGVQEEMYTAERAARFAAARAARPVGQGGEAAFKAQLGKMSGQMKRADFTSLKPLVSQADVDALVNQIDAKEGFLLGEKFTAQNGLLKLFGEAGGKVPTTGELKLLREVFGDEFISEVLRKRPSLSRLAEAGVQVAGIQRAVLTSYDMSAPLRQGLFLGAGNPKSWAKSFPTMLKSFFSEKAFHESEAEIASRTTYPLMRRAKLYLADVGGILESREERFMSSWAEKIPGVKMSERAYVGFLNRLRADVFDSMIKDANRMGAAVDGPLLRKVADYVNTASGRGGLGSMERAAVVLNTAMFSPRLFASRVRLLNPALYIRSDPVIRKQAIRSLIGMASLAATTVTLAKMSGAEVSGDWKDADFGKIKIGNTRLDMFGGFLQYIRAGANILPFLGGPYSGTSLEAAGRFARTKASPTLGMALDLLDQKDMAGNPINTPEYISSRFIPMAVQDTYDAVQEWGAPGASIAVPALLGAGVQTYE